MPKRPQRQPSEPLPHTKAPNTTRRAKPMPRTTSPEIPWFDEDDAITDAIWDRIAAEEAAAARESHETPPAKD